MTKWIGREVIKVGDRVVTPDGCGFVLSEIMGRKYTVKLDAKPKIMKTDTFEYWRNEIITVEEADRRMDAESEGRKIS